MKLRQDFFSQMAAILLYRIALDLIYIRYVVPNYGYYHFSLDNDRVLILVSYAILLPIVAMVPALLSRATLSDITIALLILIYYVPYTSLYAYSNHDIKYMLYVITYFLVLLSVNWLLIVQQGNSKSALSQDRNASDSNWFVMAIIILGLIRIVSSGIYTNFRVTFDLSDYYEYRAEAREYSMPEVVRYLLGWSNMGLTVGLIYSLVHKKRGLSLYIIICTVLAFSFNGKKSILFTLILTVTIYYMFSEDKLSRIPSYLCGLSWLGIAELLVRNGESFISKHFIRRLLFIPPHMGTLYYDFFSKHEYDYLRASVLRRLGAVSPYGNIPRFIGAQYFSGQSMAMNANTGLCGDAFANFGFASLLFTPIVIVLTFKLIEYCAGNVSFKIKMVVAVTVAYSFANGSYFTLLLTNGMLFLMVALLLLSSEDIVGHDGASRPELQGSHNWHPPVANLTTEP